MEGVKRSNDKRRPDQRSKRSESKIENNCALKHTIL